MPKMTRLPRIHFMGIGGSGISAIARMARDYGYEVTGCDLEESSITHRLRKDGIPVEIGHNPAHLKNVDLLVHTPAVFYQSIDHPEYTKAKMSGLTLTWEEFMAKFLQKDKFVIAVTGTHGKGTTTAMFARILEEAGLDPTVEIGANLLDWDGKNYRIGKSKYFLCEADEFREKFLIYRPNLAVVTSVEMDHPEFFANFEAVLKAFSKFVQGMKEPKILVINGQDEGCKKLIKTLKKLKWSGKIIDGTKVKLKIRLKQPGEHIRADAAVAWTGAKALGIPDSKIKVGLEKFSGLERRFEFRGEVEGAKLYDDYAHHPTAVAANIQAARQAYPKHRIVVVFQPHMHQRLQALYQDFIKSLKLADKVVVTDVFTRREQGVNKPTGKDLALAITAPKATYVGGDLTNVANFVERNAQKGDIVLLMGAGDIYRVSDLLLKIK